MGRFSVTFGGRIFYRRFSSPLRRPWRLSFAGRAGGMKPRIEDNGRRIW